jgi:hypothetical protein
MKKILYEILETYLEKQGTSKKLLKMEQIEKDVINLLGSLYKYEETGGYKRFYEEVMLLKEQGILQELSKPSPNWKKPSLHETYWLIPKYTRNEWNKVDIAKVMTYLNIEFYLNNKKYQTLVEWERINILYHFLINKEKHDVVSREERSLMLFKNANLPDEIEPEKFLASIHGQRLLSRLNLTQEDLKFKIVREPFHFWEHKRYPEQHSKEVLVIEGLSTYETLKLILSKGLPWNFGPIPRYLIWGEGYRISNTLDYLHELSEYPRDLTIRYSGDLDYEGFNIYLELKQRYKELNVSLAHSFYSFLITFIDGFATTIDKKQRVVDRHLVMLQLEFKDFPETFGGIQKLWKEEKRIPQECLNLETIFNKGGLTNG